MGRWLRLLVIVLVAGLASTLMAPGRAFAHASLVHSEPADGAALAAAPSRFVLHFNEEVTPLAVRIIEADGRTRTLPGPKAAAILAFDAPALPTGTFALSWRVVSEDGHPVGGSIVFSVRAPLTQSPMVSDLSDPASRAGLWVVRLLLACGLAFGIGGTIVSRFGPKGGGRLSGTLSCVLALGLAGALLLPGFQGLDALGLPLTALAQGLVWRTGAATSYGATAALAGVACATALAALPVRGAGGKFLAVLALAFAVIAPALSGHAASAPPRAVMASVVAVHMLGAALWLGALVPLAIALKLKPGDPALLGWLSPLLPLPVAALVATGAALAVVQVGRPAALVATGYGQVLLTKLLLVLVLLAIAAANRWLWTAGALAGKPVETARLARAVMFEIALGFAILGVVGRWRFTAPPRALTAAAPSSASVHIHAQQAMAELRLVPGRAGPTEASISIMTGDFGPLAAKEVTLVMSRPDLGLEPLERPAARVADGSWAVRGLTLPVAGKWRVRIQVLVDDFHLLKLDGDVEVAP